MDLKLFHFDVAIMKIFNFWNDKSICKLSFSKSLLERDSFKTSGFTTSIDIL